MKKVVMIFCCVLLAIATMISIRAMENSWEISISDLYSEIKALSNVYDGAAILSAQLLELMVKIPKDESIGKSSE